MEEPSPEGKKKANTMNLTDSLEQMTLEQIDNSEDEEVETDFDTDEDFSLEVTRSQIQIHAALRSTLGKTPMWTPASQGGSSLKKAWKILSQLVGMQLVLYCFWIQNGFSECGSRFQIYRNK